MFNKLYITIKSNNELDDSIIDPISFVLITIHCESFPAFERFQKLLNISFKDIFLQTKL